MPVKGCFFCQSSIHRGYIMMLLQEKQALPQFNYLLEPVVKGESKWLPHDIDTASFEATPRSWDDEKLIERICQPDHRCMR